MQQRRARRSVPGPRVRLRSGPTLQIPLRPSRWLRALLVALVLAAALAIHLSALGDGWMLTLPALAGWAWRDCAQCSGQTLVLRGDGSAALISAAGVERVVEPLMLHERGALGVLVLAADGRTLRWAFAGDVMPSATRRELRLWMRDHAQPREAAVGIPSSDQTTSPG